MAITDIPEPHDFELTGIDYLNLAADIVFPLYFQLSEIFPETAGFEDEIAEFWDVARRPVASALALVGQGTELLIKARIAAVSPFLLLSAGVRDWPRGSDSHDTPFATFRTLDAHELVRVHNAVATMRLDADFAAAFDRLRKRRNTIMHTVDRSLEVTARDIVVLCLESVQHILGPYRWMDLRRQYLNRTPAAIATGGDWVEAQVIREAEDLRQILTRSELKKYFGFRKAQRRYTCPTCHAADEFGILDVKTSQLRPNTPASTQVYCYVCGESTTVIRCACPRDGCKGDVIAAEEEQCLTCDEYVSVVD